MIAPKEIRKQGGKSLKITWSDNHPSEYTFRLLRQNCQCAMCVDERSGAQILKKEEVPVALDGLQVNIVGNYALGITFGDGHSTGIFAFKHMRKICPCGTCGAQAATAGDKIYMDKEDLKTRVD